MVTITLVSTLLMIFNFLKLYRKSAFLLKYVNKHSKEIFEHLKTTHAENIKKYLQYGLLWFSVDYLVSASVIRNLFGQEVTGELFVGALLFVVALYVIIPRAVFEQINLKMNYATGKLLMPTLIFGTGAYIIPTMKPGDLVDPAYAHLPDPTKLLILKMTFGFFFVMGAVCTFLMIVSLFVKCFFGVNYYISNLLSAVVRRFSAHCIKFYPEEPHEVLKTWLEAVVMLVSIVITVWNLWNLSA